MRSGIEFLQNGVEVDRQGGARGDPLRRGGELAPAVAAVRRRAGRAAAGKGDRRGRRPAGRRRKPAGPLRHLGQLEAEGRHDFGQRADDRPTLRRRTLEVRLPAQGPPHLFGRPCRRLLQIAPGPRRARHPVPHPAGDDGRREAGPGQDGAGAPARPDHRAVPGAPGKPRFDPHSHQRSDHLSGDHAQLLEQQRWTRKWPSPR